MSSAIFNMAGYTDIFTIGEYCCMYSAVNRGFSNTTESYRCFVLLIVINPLKTEFLHNFIYKFISYLTVNTLRLRYRTQPVNAVWGNSRCLL
jgi:hypothetical protein